MKSWPPPSTTSPLILARLILAGLLLAASEARASPRDSDDPRIVSVEVTDARVLEVRARRGFASQLVLPPGETVEHAAIGESRGWDPEVHENVVFLKAREHAHDTNLFVLTGRGVQRSRYSFELRLVGSEGAAPYELRLVRPAARVAEAMAEKEAAAQQNEQRQIQESLAAAPFQGARNYAYTAQGATALQPAEAFDNGRFTVLRFPGQQPLPSPYEVSADGAERLIPFHVRGDFLIIHAVVAELRLRQGHSLLCLYNDGFSFGASDSASGSVSTSVLRKPRTESPP